MPKFDVQKYTEAKASGTPDWVAWAVATPWAYFIALGVMCGIFGAFF